jgi:hypothetical protein
MQLNIVLDTNIFIYREDNSTVPENLTDLLRTIRILNYKLMLHPASLLDLQNDKDLKRKQIMLSKLGTYPVLDSPPEVREDVRFLQLIGISQNSHDYIDATILYSIYRNAADFLITEDRGIHKTAIRAGIEDRVFLIEEARSFFKKNFTNETIYQPLAIKKVPLYLLNIDDPIFNSLKNEYKDFPKWWANKCREQCHARVFFKEDKSLGALLIWKIENEAILGDPILPVKKRLKISTFKVTHNGYKIGELFIKMSIEYAIKNGIDELYLTHFRKPEDDLIRLIEDYGFYLASIKQGEDIYVKDLIVVHHENTSLSQISKKYYPSFYDGTQVRKFIVPIRPLYHDRLFVEVSKDINLFEGVGELIVEGNTIKKAYLCHSNSKKIQQNDVLVFYCSETRKSVSAIGVVEHIYLGMRNAEEVIRHVGKRSVYKINDIERLVSKPTMVIVFKLHFYLPNPLSYKFLYNHKVLSGPPQSIVEISHDKYLLVKDGGGLNERFTFN